MTGETLYARVQGKINLDFEVVPLRDRLATRAFSMLLNYDGC